MRIWSSARVATRVYLAKSSGPRSAAERHQDLEDALNDRLTANLMRCLHDLTSGRSPFLAALVEGGHVRVSGLHSKHHADWTENPLRHAHAHTSGLTRLYEVLGDRPELTLFAEGRKASSAGDDSNWAAPAHGDQSFGDN